MAGAFERTVFRHRVAVFWFLAGISCVLALMSAGLQLAFDPARHMPDTHRAAFADLRSSGAVESEIALVLTVPDGTVWSPAGLQAVFEAEAALRRVGAVDPESLISILSPQVAAPSAVDRAAGFEIRALLDDQPPSAWSDEDIAWWRGVVRRLGLDGRLVTQDGTHVLIRALIGPDVAQSLDYAGFIRTLETTVGAALDGQPVEADLIGFPVRMGRLEAALSTGLAGAGVMLGAGFLGLWLLSRSWIVAAAGTACSATPVVWLVGGMAVLGRPFDPAILPALLLVFVLALTMAAHVTARILARMCWSDTAETAARTVFARLVGPGALALAGAGGGAAALMILPVAAIRDVAILVAAGAGIAAVCVLLFLPLLLAAFTPDERWFETMSRRIENGRGSAALVLPLLRPGPAGGLAAAALCMTLIFGLLTASSLTVGGGTLLAPNAASSASQDAMARQTFGYLTDSYTVRVGLNADACEGTAGLTEQAGLAYEEVASMAVLRPIGPGPGFFAGATGPLNAVRGDTLGLLRTGPASLRAGQVLETDCSAVRVIAGADVQTPEGWTRLAGVTGDITAGAQGSALSGTRLEPGGGSLGALTALSALAGGRAMAVLAVLGVIALAMATLVLRDWRAGLAVLVPVALGLSVTAWAMTLSDIALSPESLSVLVLTACFGVLAVLGLALIWREGERDGCAATDLAGETLALGAPVTALAGGALTLGLIGLTGHAQPFAQIMMLGLAVQAGAAIALTPALLVVARWAMPVDP